MIRVLVVEDDPMVAKINKRYIESVEGFGVVKICKTEKETLNFLSKNSVDLIILDIYLPEGDGISILNKLRGHRISSDVIMVTASDEVDRIDSTLKLGVVDYLIKPFEYERLKKALNNYISRRNLLISKDKVEQGEIDKIFNSKSNEFLDLQKGLNRYTLNSIVDFFEKHQDRRFNSEEISQELDISKVTVRKYMDYLEKVGYIIKEIEYGTIGKPSYIYKRV